MDPVNQNLIVALQDRDVARQRLIRILDGAEIGTWEWENVSDTIKAGGRWGEIIGFETKSIATLAFAEFLAFPHPDDVKLLNESRTSDLALGDEAIEHEFPMMHREGHWVWILSRSRIMERTPDGKPLAMVGVHIDISDRKKLEQKLQRSQIYLSQVMDTSIAAVVVMTADVEVFYANCEAESIMGLKRSDNVGRTYSDPA